MSLEQKGADELSVDDIVCTLQASNSLPEDSLERARRASVESGERLDIVLRKLGLVSDEQMTRLWGDLSGYRIVGVDARQFHHFGS